MKYEDEPLLNERATSREDGVNSERLQKIHSFIRDVLKPAEKTIKEQETQQDTI